MGRGILPRITFQAVSAAKSRRYAAKIGAVFNSMKYKAIIDLNESSVGFGVSFRLGL